MCTHLTYPYAILSHFLVRLGEDRSESSKHTARQTHQTSLEMVTTRMAVFKELSSLFLKAGIQCGLSKDMRHSACQLQWSVQVKTTAEVKIAQWHLQ